MTPLEIRMLSIEKAHNELALAKDYADFLLSAVDDTDFKARLFALDTRQGNSIQSIQDLYHFLIGE